MEKNKRSKNIYYAFIILLTLTMTLPWVFSRATVSATAAADSKDDLTNQPADRPVIALTFDDGPRADTTSRLLDGLRERDVRATFFVIGEQIEGNEDIIRQMARDGHQIGNHTFTHYRLQGAMRDTVIQEVNKTEVALASVLGEGSYWLRPPYGLMNEQEKKLITTPMVHWSVDPEDWKLLNADRVTERVCANVKDGDIVLLHDFYPSSVSAAFQIVDRLKMQGYEFVTVEELMRRKGTVPQAGKLYCNAWKER